MTAVAMTMAATMPWIPHSKILAFRSCRGVRWKNFCISLNGSFNTPDRFVMLASGRAHVVAVADGRVFDARAYEPYRAR